MESNHTGKAIFAAGCFWGVQAYFDQVPGLISTRVGYIGGSHPYPTYEDVCSRNTGHAEAIEITFDLKKITFETLVRHFFRMHDPTQLNQQGPDIGYQYRSAIFYFDDKQKTVAENIKTELSSHFKQPIVTEISPAQAFYEAEEYHQKYTEKTGVGMCHIPYKAI